VQRKTQTPLADGKIVVSIAYPPFEFARVKRLKVST